MGVAERYEKRKKENKEIDNAPLGVAGRYELRNLGAQIESFSKTNNSFMNKAVEEFDSPKYVTSDWYDNYSKEIASQKQQATNIQNTLKKYSSYLTEDYAKNANDYINSVLGEYNKVGEYAKSLYKSSSPYKTEEEYKKAYADWLNVDADTTAENATARQDIYEENKNKIVDLQKQHDDIIAQYDSNTSQNEKYVKTQDTVSLHSMLQQTAKIKKQIEAIKAENVAYERTQHDIDKAYITSHNSDFKEYAYNPNVTNITREEARDYEVRATGGLTEKYNKETGSFDYYDSLGTLVDDKYYETYKQPMVEDKLGLYLSSSEEEKQNASYATMNSRPNDYLDTLFQGHRYHWDQLKEDEIDIYYYKYNKEGKEEAEKYLDSMKGLLGKRANNELIAAYHDANALEKIALNIVTVPASILGGAASILSTVAEGEYNPYVSGEISLFANTIRGETAKEIDQATGGLAIPYIDFSFGDAYQSLMSMADSMVGVGTLGKGYTYFMGTSAAINTAQDMYDRGASMGQIFAGALASGVAETAFESISVKGLDDMMKNIGKNTGKEMLIDLLWQSAKEAGEEIGTEITNTLADGIIMGGASNWELQKLKYMATGSTEEEAIKKAFLNDVVPQVLNAGMGGFISGGGSGGLVNIANSITNTLAHGQYQAETGESIYKNDNISKLVNDAKATNNSKLMKLAEQVAGVKQNVNSATQAQEGLKNRDYKKIGKLYEGTLKEQHNTVTVAEKRAVSEYIKSKLETDIVDDVDKAVKVLSKAYFGEKLTKAETEYFKKIGGKEIITEANESQDLKNSVKNQIREPLTNYISTNNLTNISRLNTALGVDNNKKLDISEDGKTKIKSTGEEITINSDSPLSEKKGKTYLNTDKGSVLLDDVEFSSQEEALLYESFSDMSPTIANAVIQRYTDIKNVESTPDITTYIRGYQQGINLYGKYNFKGVGIDISKNSFLADLSPDDQAFALKLGRDAMKIEIGKERESVRRIENTNRIKGKVILEESAKGQSYSKIQKSSVEVLKVLASAMGINIFLYDSTRDKSKAKYNGKYDPKTDIMYLDISAGMNHDQTIMYTMGHELTHFIKKWSLEKFQVFADFLIEQYGEHGVSVENLIARKMKQLECGEKEAYEELVADACETMLLDSNAVEKIALLNKKDSTIVEKIKEYIVKLLSKVKELYKGLMPDSAEAKAVREMQDSIGRLAELFEEAAVDAVKNKQAVGKYNKKSTGIHFSQKISEYSYDMQTVIKDYIDAVDENIPAFIKQHLDTDNVKFGRYTISATNDKQNKDIQKLLGINTVGYSNAFNTNSVQHIRKRHGINGEADSSMRDELDFARIGYVLHNYDDVYIIKDGVDEVKSHEFMNANNEPAPMVMYTKKINGTYYIAQAIPESKYKKIWVVSAWIEKNKEAVTQALNYDIKSNVEKSLASPTSTNIIPNSTEKVNSDTKNSVRRIVDVNGKDYGIGVYLDSTLLDNLSEAERKQMVKMFVVEELAGKSFTAYDSNNSPININIAKKGAGFKNSKNKYVSANKDLYSKNTNHIIKQEAIVLADELIESAKYDRSESAKYSHGWVDNYGKSHWEYWYVYIQERDNSVWLATLNIANTADGRKILYDIDPIKKVEGAVKSAHISTNSSVSQNNSVVNSNSMQKTENNSSQIKNSVRRNNDYSYEALISKPDMKITEVDSENVPTNRADVIHKAKQNAAKIGKYNPKNDNVSVYVDDIGTDIVIGKKGLIHGLNRQFKEISAVTIKTGEIIKNAIKVNDLITRSENIDKTYVLISAAQNENGDLHLVRFVVNKYSNELTSMDVLYAINSKKESTAVLNAPPLSRVDYRTTISISELLEYVNKYFPDILPEDVLKHFGYTSRPEGKLGESALYSVRETPDNKLFSPKYADNLVDSFGISKLGDYIHVQRKVLQTLESEKFFTNTVNRNRTDINRESGMTIETNKSGIDETFNLHNYTRVGKGKKLAKLAVIRRLPEIIQNGHMVKSNENNMYNGPETNKQFAYIEYTLEEDGKNITVQLDIKKSPQKNKFWVHKILDIKDVSDFPASTVDGTEAGQKSIADEGIISQEFNSVNTKNSTREILDNQPGDIDLYTEKQYNDYGWVRVNNVLSENEYSHFNRQFSDAKHLKYKYTRTSEGEYIIPCGESYNKLVFVKGSYQKPIITNVIYVNSNFHETITQITEDIKNYAKESQRKLYQVFEMYAGLEYIKRHEVSNYESYIQLKRERVDRNGIEESDFDNSVGEDRRGSIGKDTNSRGTDESGIKNSIRLPSNRTILEGSLDSIDDTTVAGQFELEKLKEYLNTLSEYDNLQEKLQDVNSRIRPTYSVKKGEKRDYKELSKLRDEKVKTQNRIAIYNNILARLEMSEPLKSVIERAEAQGLDRTEEVLNAKAARRVESVKARYAREQLQKVVVETTDWLIKQPKDKVRIPDKLRVALGELLESIDMTSHKRNPKGKTAKNDIRLSKNLRKLSDVVANIRKTFDESMKECEDGIIIESSVEFLNLPKNYVSQLKELADEIEKSKPDTIENSKSKYNGKYVVSRMTALQIDALRKMISTITQATKQMGVLHQNNLFVKSEELGNKQIDYLKSLKKRKTLSSIVDFTYWNSVVPIDIFDRFGESGQSIFKELIEADAKLSFLEKEILKFAEDNWQNKKVDEWNNDYKDFQLSDEKTVISISTAQKMSIYCLVQRENSNRGTDRETKHLTSGETVIIGEKSRRKNRVDTRGRLTQKDITAIISSLTDEQINIAKKIQEFMSTECARWGNEYTRKHFLQTMFTEKNYFPFETHRESSEGVMPEAKQADMYRLLNISAMNSLTRGADSGLVIRNIFEVFSQHAVDMAKLNAYGDALLDLLKWYNYAKVDRAKDSKGNTVTRVDSSVKRSMNEAFGNVANNYIMNLIRDINSSVSDLREINLISKVLKGAKTAAVGANLRVALLQLTSYPRAAIVLHPKNIVKALKPNLKDIKFQELKRNIELSRQYCGIALKKSMGFFDTNVSRSIEAKIANKGSAYDWLIEHSLSLAEAMDTLTIANLWKACEYEVEETWKGGKNTEEFYKEVGTKLSDVIYRTQVVDSILTRSDAMRSKTIFMKEITSFKAEPTITHSIFMNALFEWRTNGKKSAAIRATIVTLFTAGITALMESISDTWRDEEDDEEFGKNLLFSFLENAIFIGNTPLIGEASSFIYELSNRLLGTEFSVYDNEGLINQTFNNLIAVIGIWENLAEGKGTVYNALYKTTQVASQLSGLPIANTMREVVLAWNNIVGYFDETLEIRRYDMSGEALRKNIYDAIIAGEEDKLTKYEASTTNVRMALRDNDPRIEDAAEAKIDGNMEEFKRIVLEIKSEKHFSQDDIVVAVNLMINELRSNKTSKDIWEYDDEDSNSVFSYTDLNDELEAGDISSAKNIIEDIVANKTNQYIDNGDRKRDAKAKAEAAVRSSITSYWKKRYLEAYEKKDSAEMLKIRRMLFQLNLYDSVSTTVSNWVKNSKKK